MLRLPFAALRPSTPTLRTLSTSTSLFHRPMPQRPAPPPEEAFTEKFLCGTGPGGQKINKTSSAVQLKHLETGIVVKCQATRSRSQNRKIARQLLATRLEALEKGDQSRAAIVGAVKAKRKSSASKKSKRKYRALEEEKAAGMAEEIGETEGQAEVEMRGAAHAPEVRSEEAAATAKLP